MEMKTYTGCFEIAVPSPLVEIVESSAPIAPLATALSIQIMKMLLTFINNTTV